jgi:hypothetical protein
MSRSAYERSLEDVLSAISAGNGSDEGFCITYCLAAKDLDAIQKHAIPMPYGWKAEIMDVSRAYASEASDAIESLDIGVLDGDEDAYLAATLIPIFAIGNTVARLTKVAGVSGYTAIPGTGAAIVVVTTSAGTVGIADFFITIRFYR